MMNNFLFRLEKVSVKIKNQIILKDISLRFDEPTGIVGLVGLNGAGKTTLIKSIFGFYKIYRGKIIRNEQDIAFCVDVPDFPSDMTVIEVLKYSRWLGSKPVSSNKFYDDILNLVGLLNVKNREISHFSRGMKQRLGIACVLVLEPKVIFLDEPTSALDPEGREDVLKIIRLLGKTKLVIFSSHILNDVQNISERIIILHKGQKIYDGKKSALLNNHDNTTIITANSNENANKITKQLRQVGNENIECLDCKIKVNYKSLFDIIKNLDAVSCQYVVKIETQYKNLEESFVELIGKD